MSAINVARAGALPKVRYVAPKSATSPRFARLRSPLGPFLTGPPQFFHPSVPDQRTAASVEFNIHKGGSGGLFRASKVWDFKSFFVVLGPGKRARFASRATKWLGAVTWKIGLRKCEATQESGRRPKAGCD